MLERIHLHYTTATITATIAAALAVAVSFGAQLSQDQIHNVLTLVGLIAAALTIGGGTKSAGMIRAGLGTGSKLHFTSATIVSVVGAAIAVAVSFGLHMTHENTTSLLTLVGLLAGGIIGGGSIKSNALLKAGAHPIQKAQRRAVESKMLDEAVAAAQARPERPFVVGTATEGAAPGREVKVTLRTDLGGEPLPLRRGGRGSHPVLKVHGSFEGMPLGKLEPRHDPRTPMLAEFMSQAAALGRKLPKATHRLDPVAAALGGDFGMMGNDGYSDCTVAALGHAIQMWTGAHGAPVTLTAAQILDVYWKTGTKDDGRVMFDVLKYVAHNPLAGHAIGAYVGVGLRRFRHRDVKAAIDLFGGCYLGVALPESAQTQHVWDVTGNPDGHGPAEWGSWGGHAIWLPDYDHDGPTCITWAHELKMTWRFLDAYADEAYAIIAPDWLEGGKTIEGIDLAALTAYLDKIKSGIQPPQ